MEQWTSAFVVEPWRQWVTVIVGFVVGFVGQDCGGGGDCAVVVMGGSIVKQCFGDGGVSLRGLMGVGCGMCGFDGFYFDFLLWVLWPVVIAFDSWLIFCWGMCGFDGGADGGGGDGFVVVEVAMVWVRFGVYGHLGRIWVVWIRFGGVWVAEFWWRCCVDLLERETERQRGKRNGKVERETEFFILLVVGMVYIILISCMRKQKLGYLVSCKM